MSNLKRNFVVNEHLDVAIAAHQDALRDGDAELAHLLLRVVVLAKTANLTDLRRLLDYLTALPTTAWPDGYMREPTLAGIARSIAWQAEL